MSDPDQEDTQPDLLATLVRSLERRARLSDPLERREHDRETAELAQLVANAAARPMRTDPVSTPPRRVSVAMGLAVLSAPHFSATLPTIRQGTMDPNDAPRRPLQLGPAVPPEAFERALGLGSWEIDEMRDEIDRRVGGVLKQVRTVNWLWSHFAQPDHGGAQTLARVLVPGLTQEQLDVVWRGGQLYVLADTEPLSPAALFLPWLRPTSRTGPMTFESRGVDPGLRVRLAKGVGADDREVGELLDRIVTLLPRRSAASLLQHDHWRSHGYAGVTDLGAAYNRGLALTEPEPTDGIDWKVWLVVKPGEPLTTRYPPERLFDALAIPRVGALLRQLHAGMLASADRAVGRPDRGPRLEDVDLYDVPQHMQRILDPLFHWAERPSTHLLLSRATERPLEEVTALMSTLQASWRQHVTARWTAPPSARAPSVSTLLVQHLVAVHHSLLRIVRWPADPRSPHADLALLFAAHYLRESSLERSWFRTKTVTDDDPLPDEPATILPPEDPVGHWFWPLWQRLLNEMERDENATPRLS